MKLLSEGRAEIDMKEKPFMSLFFDRFVRTMIYMVLFFAPLSNAFLNSWAKTLIHLITLVALAAFLLKCILVRQWKWIRTPTDFPFLTLLLWCILTSFFSVHRPTSLWAGVMVTNCVLLFYLTLYAFQTRNHLRGLIRIILATAFIVSLIGLINKFWGNPFPFWHYEYIRGNEGQLLSTFSNRNHLASYIVIMIPLTIGFMLTGPERGGFFLWGIALFLFIAVLMMCLARSAWIAVFSALLLLVFMLFLSGYYDRKKIIGVTVGGLIFGLVVLLLNTEIMRRLLTLGTDNLSGRLTVWRNVISMIRDHPLTGTGPGTFTHAFTLYHPPAYDYRQTLAHNEYLQFMAEAGLPTVPGILWLLLSIFSMGFKKIKHPSRLVRGTAIGAVAAFVATLVDALASFNFHLPAVSLTASVLIAVIVSPEPDSSSKQSF